MLQVADAASVAMIASRAPSKFWVRFACREDACAACCQEMPKRQQGRPSTELKNMT